MSSVVYDMDVLVEKWKPILKTATIYPEYWRDIATYCEKHQDYAFPSLAISIRVISKLDLSKVEFTDFREICSPVKNHMIITPEQIQDIQSKVGIDVLAITESTLIEEMVSYLNYQIKNEGGIYINGLFNIELVDRPGDSKIEITGHILSFNVHRMKKLKKVKMLLDEKRKDSSSI